MHEEIHDLAEQIYNIGYRQGYQAGCKDTQEAMAGEKAYQQGLIDAWECARKMHHFNMETISRLCEDIYDMSFDEFICSKTASEAIDKLKHYEEEQKIK